MKKVSDYFGCKVFDDRVMKARLSSKVYQSLRKTIDEGAKLDISVANAVAAAMKDQVSPEVKNKRSDVLLELAERGKKAYEAKYEDAELEVLVEEVLHREDGTYLRGHTEIIRQLVHLLTHYMKIILSLHRIKALQLLYVLLS